MLQNFNRSCRSKSLDASISTPLSFRALWSFEQHPYDRQLSRVVMLLLLRTVVSRLCVKWLMHSGPPGHIEVYSECAVVVSFGARQAEEAEEPVHRKAFDGCRRISETMILFLYAIEIGVVGAKWRRENRCERNSFGYKFEKI